MRGVTRLHRALIRMEKGSQTGCLTTSKEQILFSIKNYLLKISKEKTISSSVDDSGLGFDWICLPHAPALKQDY